METVTAEDVRAKLAELEKWLHDRAEYNEERISVDSTGVCRGLACAYRNVIDQVDQLLDEL